jgi:integrase
MVKKMAIKPQAGFMRAAGVSMETRQVLLGHTNGQITTHYSAAELEELIYAVEKVCERKEGIVLRMVK